jgi:hypothetical protein
MTMHGLAAVCLVLAVQAAVAEENWIVLGYKAQGKFSLDTASIARNNPVRIDLDLRQVHVKVEWQDSGGGYDQLDSKLVFDCENQTFGNGEDTFSLKGELVKHVMHDDVDLLKVSADVTIKAWEKVCEKPFDRSDLAPPELPDNSTMI